MGGGWPRALVLVASVHLLTTPGRWIVTDQSEYLVTAQRLLAKGTFLLAGPGETDPRLPWVKAQPTQATRSRLLPLTSLTLAPLLWMDRLLGWDHPVEHGRLVHLQGHLFTLGALALLGFGLRLRGASVRAAAAAVALAGLAWPVWQISRRGGPEPVLAFLVCLFLAGDAAGRRVGPAASRRAAAIMAAACALLPWANPTGALLGAALLAGSALDRWSGHSTAPLRPLSLAAGSYAVSLLCLVVLWNHLFQGHWWMGGYARFYGGMESLLGVQSPMPGLALHLRSLALEGPFLLALALLGAWAAGRGGTGVLAVPVCLTASLLVMFSTFPEPEPTRRLAAVWPAWAAAVGRTWDRRAWPSPLPQAVLAGAGLLGYFWFMAVEGRYHLGPGGFYYPSVLWVRLWTEGRSAWLYLGPGLALAGLALCAGAATWTLFSRGRPAALAS